MNTRRWLMLVTGLAALASAATANAVLAPKKASQLVLLRTTGMPCVVSGSVSFDTQQLADTTPVPFSIPAKDK